jgi:predicted nuclease of predicted toxin-antitoxin system
MKFVVDAQLPPMLARWLRQAGHEAQPVREIGLREAEDFDIWRHALAAGAVIVTKDEDFVGLAQQMVSGPVVIWLRVGNTSNPALMEWLAPRWPQVLAQLAQGHRLIEVR